MNLATYKRFDTGNGPGVSQSVFVSGCSHHSCDGCFNDEAWDFKYGEKFTDEKQMEIIQDLKHPSVRGLSILGGEPFDNTKGLISFVKKVKKETNKTIWIWSGYLYENLIKNEDNLELLKMVDVLVDGPFKMDLKQLDLMYRGSSNQRVIELKNGKINYINRLI